MDTHNHKHHKYYSQNETSNKKLLKSLINQTSIGKGDLVYDIGAGRGNITEALLEKGARVVSIEKDGNLYRKLQQRFLNREAVSLHHADFLLWEFSPGHRYKVFANIPFIQTSEIIRKLMFGNAPPEDCYLIMQKEAALKYAGIPRETLASLLIKPGFWVDIVYYFSGNDFSPTPGVDIVLMQLEKRKCRLIPEMYYAMYRDFIVFCREGTDRTIKKALKNFFTYDQIKQLAELSGFDMHARPADLNFMQYLCIFQFLLGENLKNIAFIQGAEARLERQRVKLKVIHRTIKKR
jgi:16S rRNA A1518/A1519 N6-dimethyltransferase RsmA/KsgA/DIM1 with predicted DNA glycosylase/AP lyase activity